MVPNVNKDRNRRKISAAVLDYHMLDVIPHVSAKFDHDIVSDRMGDKGKGVARDETSKDKTDIYHGSSFLKQVASSASGLARSSFAVPNVNELNESTVSLTRAGKGQSSSSTGNSNWDESSLPAVQLDGPSRISNTFRTGHSEEHIASSEEEFSSFLKGVPLFTPSEEATNGLLATASEYNLRDTSVSFVTQPTDYISLTVAEVEARDGEVVSNMLSTPGGLGDDYFEPPSPIEEHINWGLSREGIRRLTAIITSAETNSDPRLLNFSPVFEDLTSLDEIAALKERHSKLQKNAPQSPELREVDDRLKESYQMWDAALKSYTDAVWGPDHLQEVMVEVDLGKKIEQLATAEAQDKALRRLNAIWGHFRGF